MIGMWPIGLSTCCSMTREGQAPAEPELGCRHELRPRPPSHTYRNEAIVHNGYYSAKFKPWKPTQADYEELYSFRTSHFHVTWPNHRRQ